ncbi:MAG: NifU family protein [Bdellovibrionales bacterium]|nr:NifU family protein [Bdellovibrionales bacterium]
MSIPAISPNDILVRAQDTPNPAALKFIINYAVKAEGRTTFHTIEECEEVPLARDLFVLPGVKQLYFFENTITITHDIDVIQANFEEQVISVIKTRLPTHNYHFLTAEDGPSKKGTIDRSHLSPELKQIEEILDRTIRPGLQADGGDIEILEFKDNELKIIYQGACGGCPSSMMGTLDAIQGILRHELKNEGLIVSPI